MLKRTFNYTDYNGNPVTEDYYFNLTRAEILEIEMSTDKAVGLEAMILELEAERNGKKIMELFKQIIRMSIGKKSADGRRFIKNDEIADEFMQTEAYSDLLIELLDAEKGAAFFNAIIPKAETSAIPAPPVK